MVRIEGVKETIAEEDELVEEDEISRKEDQVTAKFYFTHASSYRLHKSSYPSMTGLSFYYRINSLLAEGGGVAGGDGEVEDPDHQGGGGQGQRSEIIL